MLSARFLHHYISPFVIVSCEEISWDCAKSCFSLYVYPIILAPIDVPYLQQFWQWHLPNDFFLLIPFLLHLVGILLYTDSWMFVFIQRIITSYCHYLFSCSSFPRLGHWELPIVGSCVLSVCPCSHYPYLLSVLIYTGNTFRIANAIPMKNKL